MSSEGSLAVSAAGWRVLSSVRAAVSSSLEKRFRSGEGVAASLA